MTTPEGPMTLIRVEDRSHRHAADAQGTEWYFDAVSFWYDLRPLEPELPQCHGFHGRIEAKNGVMSD